MTRPPYLEDVVRQHALHPGGDGDAHAVLPEQELKQLEVLRDELLGDVPIRIRGEYAGDAAVGDDGGVPLLYIQHVAGVVSEGGREGMSGEGSGDRRIG